MAFNIYYFPMHIHTYNGDDTEKVDSNALLYFAVGIAHKMHKR